MTTITDANDTTFDPRSTQSADTEHRSGTKRALDEIGHVIDSVIGAANAAYDDDDAASASGQSLTSSHPPKRTRRDVLAPDGSVLGPDGIGADNNDPAHRAQLLQLVALATVGRSSVKDVDDDIDFYLTIGQPAVFREMIESISSLLDERLPLIIDSSGSFSGVRISGLEKSKTCFLRGQFSCDAAYVSAGAVARNGGIENRIEGVSTVERMTRFHVETKILKPLLAAMPKTMGLRIVKSARYDEIVLGCYDGPSTKCQDTACVPVVVAHTSDVASGGEEGEATAGDFDDDDPACWTMETAVEYDALFSLNVALLREAVGLATTLGVKEVVFAVKEPREQLRGGRPASVRHAVLVVSVLGNGSFSRRFYATGPWEDAGNGDGGTPVQQARPSPPDSAASTPRSYTVGAEGDGSMSTELESTLEQCYANTYDIDRMMPFLKGIRGAVYVSMGRDAPISIAHGNTQYRVEMTQAPKKVDDN
jgi:hypothetical protein